MSEISQSEPKVLVPYPGPDSSGAVEDIFLYLRPETNGVAVESTLLKVITECRKAGEGISLIYLANIPGEFIVANHLVERHYEQKFYFAVHGRRAFTASMRDAVEEHFGVAWEETNIIGGFEALNLLHKSPDELHATWVPDKDVLVADGQSIKRIGDLLVVNYDIPALLAKNNRETDIAVMLFRCSDYDYFDDLVDRMHQALVSTHVLSPSTPLGRAFHFSRGPFEQLLDGRDYLYRESSELVPVSELSFVQYAEHRGHALDELLSVVRNPIGHFLMDDGSMREENIFVYTADDTYKESINKLEQLRAQVWTRH